jgi:nitrous oxidase accessory protein
MNLERAAATGTRRTGLLGLLAAALLGASAFLPYWQARLFAPQYRNGLTATMYLTKVTGDVDEIDELNHYVGVVKLGTLALWEKRLALPGLALLILLCLTAFKEGVPGPRWAKVAPVVAYPWIFLADMKYWMHLASTKLDPMAPLKLKPFVIPVVGTGKVGQFKSVLGPQAGFYLAVAAGLLLLYGLWLERKGEKSPPKPPKAALVALGALALLALGLSARAEPLQPLLDAAQPGAVLELGDRSYSGPAVIDKALTLKGEGAVIDASGRGTVLTVKAANVKLEGLVLRASGDSMLNEDAGLRVEAAGVQARKLRVEDVLFGAFASNAPGFVLEDSSFLGKAHEMGRRGDLIRIWNSDRVRLSRNTLDGGRDMVLWFSTGSIVEGNVARNGRYGLHFMYTNGATVRDNAFLDNSVGFYVMYSRDLLVENNRFERHRGPSGSGLGLKESSSITARGNLFRDNRQALYLDTSPLIETDANVFSGNRFVYNDVGVAMLPGLRGNTFTGNDFEDNLQQAGVRGGGQLSGNDWNGNHWSDYAGWAKPGSLSGAVAYKADRLFERLADAKPAVRFFLYTPASEAAEFAARAFPLFKPKPVLVDERPLIRPAVPAPPQSAPEFQLAAVWLPAGLLSFSAAALALASRGARSSRPREALPRPADSQAMIWAASLAKGYGDRLLFSDLSFTAMPGECVVLWGSNGAGKSTLMRCLLGVEACEGLLYIDGQDVSKDPAGARERVGFLAQEFAGYDWTVRRAMEFVCDVRGLDHAAITPALERCGLKGQEKKAVPALSGGMKQKLALAQAIIADPPVLLLDEPCSSLDLKSRRELVAILSSLKGTRTIVMTSHDLEEVAALADRVLWLEAGAPARMVKPEAFLSEIRRPS